MLTAKTYVFLLTTGRAGSMFVQSLFDSHPAVFTVPVYENFYLTYEKIKHLDVEKIARYLADKSYLRLIFNKQKTEAFGDFSLASVSADFFIKSFIKNYKGTSASAKHFHESILFAFAEAAKIDLTQKSHIVCHFHVPEKLDEVAHDYPNAYWIHCVRDPRAMFYSHFSLMKAQGRGNLFCWFRALEGILIRWKKIKTFAASIQQKNVLVLRLEDLHQSLIAEMSKLYDICGLEKRDEVRSTLFGFPYTSSSVHNKKITGANRSVVTEKFKLAINVDELMFLETLCKEMMETFHYRAYTKANMDKKQLAFFLREEKIPVLLYNAWRFSISENLKEIYKGVKFEVLQRLGLSRPAHVLLNAKSLIQFERNYAKQGAAIINTFLE